MVWQYGKKQTCNTTNKGKRNKTYKKRFSLHEITRKVKVESIENSSEVRTDVLVKRRPSFPTHSQLSKATKSQCI